LTGKSPVSPALEGGGKEHNIIRKLPYLETTPFRAWNFTFEGGNDVRGYGKSN
jgi:hypothetical protein